MSRGKTIRILLNDGTITGIRYADIMNWTGQALVCPRSRISELRDWPESKRRGVYLLLGTSDEVDQEMVYIGEAEDVLGRITHHLNEKVFWREAILFTSKDPSLTRSDVEYLEARLYQLTKTAGRYGLINKNEPQKPPLSRSDEHGMEEFIDNIRLLLGALGHWLLEPIIPHQSVTYTLPTSPQTPTTDDISISTSERANELLYLKTRNADAIGLRTYEGLVVLKESKATLNETPTLHDRYREIRKQLVNDKVMIFSQEGYVFSQDYLFSSPSKAACVLTGASTNGLTSWKTSDGIPLSRLEQSVTNLID